MDQILISSTVHKCCQVLFFLLQDGGVLMANENVKIVQHGARCSLTVVCSEGEDSGIYTCYAHNDSGQASCEAQLTVEEGKISAGSSSLSVITHIGEREIKRVRWWS